MAIKFKGIDLDSNLERIIPHIAAAEEYGGVLQHLQTVWDNLSLLGQLSGTGTDMSGTRRAFNELAVSLLNQLGKEALKKCLQEMACRAQVAINILVRNLFERTADIGFLACDEDIRGFLRTFAAAPAAAVHATAAPAAAADRDDAVATLRRRFGEYVRKYSVYSDIILLDPKGNILARLRDEDATAASADPLIRTAIETKAAYVESFHATDLVAGGKPALIYAYRVTDDGGAVLGVLCLCFRFENEAELIFSNLVGRDDWAVVTILDAAGLVIASSDPIHIPVGARLAPVLDAEYRVVKFGAMEYIATSRAAQPYQGYGGLGWYGHVMIPIQHAFNDSTAKTLATIEPDVLGRIVHASALFTEELRHIPSKAERIQRELNRSVWNGNASQGASSQGSSSGASQANSSQAGTATFSKILLKEISDTGARTKDVFEGSIADLHETVVTSLLRNNQFHAALAIDIMDRNLYERANDCRWWALAAVFADLLSRPPLSEQDAGVIGSILRTINSLYTVYSNLIVFDGEGRVVATSNAAASDRVDTTLADEWAAHILALRDAQGYAVSAFVPTPLYDDRPTYIYGAAIRTPQHQKAVGGVAIVFDSEPQFAAMLKDALPRDGAGEIKHGGFALFVERDGRVIACSDDHFRPGDTLSIDDAFLSLAPGAGYSGVTVLGDTYYAVGASASSGYREYKGADDVYRNDVIALVFAQLCDVKAQASKVAVRRLSVRSDRMQAGTKEDIATFLIGRRWFAARSDEIVEAIDAAGVVPLPLMPPGMAGCVRYRDGHLPVVDLLRVLEPGAKGAQAARAAAQVVVMAPSNGVRFGLLVDDLGEIAEVLTERLTPLPPLVAHQHMIADSALAPNGDDDGELIVMLRADRLRDNLADTAARAAAATTARAANPMAPKRAAAGGR
jgi:chemotaxis signal transduction protein